MGRKEFSEPVQNDGTTFQASVSGSSVDVTNRDGRNLGNVDVTSLPSPTQAVLTGLTQGQDTVSTSGTAVALNGGTSLAIPDGAQLRIKALPSNSSSMWIGDSTVTTTNGFALSPGEAVYLALSDVSSVYVDASTGGDSVSWCVEQ